MADDDWEKWADDDAPDVLQEQAKVNPEVAEVVKTQQLKEEQKQKEAKLSKDSQAQQKSKQSDMNNVFDLFMSEETLKDKKVTSTDFKLIGENLANKMNQSAISPLNTRDFLRSLISKLDKKLGFKEWEEIYQIVDQIYLEKKKKFEEEEAQKKKQQVTKGAPKGISWGKTKNIVQNDDDFFDDDEDDFM